MGKSLAGAKITFESDLKSAFEEAMEEALYDAYMTQFSKIDNPEAAKISQEVEKRMKDAAEKFSKEAAEKFSQKVSKTIADAVYNYVKEMTITINHIPKGTLISPTGPVTGVVAVLPNEVTII